MKKTIEEYNLQDKKVIIRCDLNVPIKDGHIEDETRIKASLKTIKYAIDKGAKVIIMSHLGKVKAESDKQDKSLYPISIKLQELLNIPVQFSHQTRGSDLERQVANLKGGEVLLIENTRFEDIDGKKESTCNDALAKYWASLGDIFINDAYGTSHRCHASNVGIARYLPSGLGFLVQEEITKLDNIMSEDTHPLIVIMGGKKVSDKIGVIKNLLPKCDKLIIGGAMAYTFLKAEGYNVGSSIVEDEYLKYCQELLQKNAGKIILPIDSVTSTSLDGRETNIKTNDNFNSMDIGFDIGPKTIKLFQDHLKTAKRVIINGPMGVFEDSKYEQGTKSLYEYLANSHIKTLIGGGDSASSVSKLGFGGKFYHISTGGGATLAYLEGKDLPAISVISDA